VRGKNFLANCGELRNLGEGFCNIITNKGKKAAFTLAETLIAIGIIGVVAALTIPNLQNAYKAHKLRTQFFKSYSMLKQVVLKMQDEGDNLDPREASPMDFAKHLKIAVNCIIDYHHALNTSECFAQFRGNTYKTIDGGTATYYLFDDGQYILQDGTQLLFEGGTWDNLFYISVDLNGYATPPNIWGYDVFTFQLIDEKLLPMGALKTHFQDQDTYCNKDGSGNYNGVACAQRAATDPDYFKWVVKNVK
jgi:type II secretory pathway pseudopilin PulG